MFEKFDEAATDVLSASRHECMRLRSIDVLPEHLLLAVTRDAHNLAARALASMNIEPENIQKELERSVNESAQGQVETTYIPYDTICFTQAAKRVFERANDYRRFFGRDRVSPEHILLGLIDSGDGAVKLLEELGANLTFLRRQVMNFVAMQDCMNAAAPTPKSTVVLGISEIVNGQIDGVEHLQRLATASDTRALHLPERCELVLMVFLAYLPEFLVTQVAYQRYLLEETVKLLQRRTGPLDKETVATMVSQTAQNLRSETRAIIEHLWTQEYRILNQMPDEAELEEIGSVIEDLWWTYSEEIALNEVFDEALDDYRRKHVLNLQKRKLEISQRLSKLRSRLDETVRQCFLKRTLSA